MQEADFLNICSDKQLWDWMRKESIVPHPHHAGSERENFLKKLYKRVRERTYYPQPALNYLTLNKGGGVLRVVPVLSIEDLCVYYYCVRKLERFIAKNRVSTTFGGFGLSGKLRRAEEVELDDALNAARKEDIVYIDEYGNGDDVGYVFSQKKWYHEWGDFNRKLFFCCARNKRGYVAQADISNFYDSISLDSLEYKLRKAVGANSNDTVYLLMHFLRFWNRHIYFYRQQGVGLPQDLFGECSRILANHFLQNYDARISKFCKQIGAQYFRYADDQLFFADNKAALELIIAKASSLLMKEGLNFNQKKVKTSSVKDLKANFAFDNFNALAGPAHLIPRSALQREISFYLLNRRNLRKDGISFLRRILNILKDSDNGRLKLKRFKKFLISKHFLTQNYYLTHRDVQKIYDLLNKSEQKILLKFINLNIQNSHYSGYLYEMRRFFEQNGISTRSVSHRITKVKNLYQFAK